MHVNKSNRVATVIFESSDEEKFFDTLITVINGASKQDVHNAVENYQKQVKTCGEETQQGNMVYKCGLPKGHRGKYHFPLLMWSKN